MLQGGQRLRYEFGKGKSVPRVDNDGWIERRVALHPAEDLGVVMVGALKPRVSRDGRNDCQSSSGEGVFHLCEYDGD
jgi:hypothetical protein